MVPGSTYPQAAEPATTGLTPNAWAYEAAYREAQGRLRTAGLLAMIGGAILLLLSFLLMIAWSVLGWGTGAAVAFLFGVIPGGVIIYGGGRMGASAEAADTWSLLLTVLALLSFFSSGGLLIGAMVTLVAAWLARGAARSMPSALPPVYVGSPMPAPAYYSPAPSWSGIPPAPGYPGAPPFPYADPMQAPPPPAAPAPAPPAPPPAPVTVTALPAPPAATTWTRAVLEEFLAMDAARSFSLEGLNLIDYAKLREAASAQGEMRAKVSTRAAELRGRLEQDLADMNAIDDILRDRAVEWYRDSPGDPEWSKTRGAAWAGLVSESHTAGGARTASLSDRLQALRDALGSASAAPKRGLFGRGAAPSAPAPPSSASTSLAAQVIQAGLDDLAAGPRAAGAPFPLLRLAELAAEKTPGAVNQALAELFKADARAPIVLLHPSRYPGFEFVVIRVPPANAAGAAIAYEIVCAPADAPPTEASLATPVPRVVGLVPVDISPAVWEEEHPAPDAWPQILAECERRRERLPPPPSNFRRLPAYFDLRRLLIGDANARRTFLAVKWRGKPPGLGLVAQLLSERTLLPEVETDGEYLEAELSDIERGDIVWRPPGLRWTLAPGVTVERAQSPDGPVYRLV